MELKKEVEAADIEDSQYGATIKLNINGENNSNTHRNTIN